MNKQDEALYIRRRTSLSENILALGRYLRAKGMMIGPSELSDGLRVLTMQTVDDQDLMQLSLRTVWTRSPAEQQLFDTYYPQYWNELKRAVDAKRKQGEELEEHSSSAQQEEGSPAVDAFISLKNWLHGHREEESDIEAATYSAGESLSTKDFSSFKGEDIQEVVQLVRTMARTLARRYKRRYEVHPHAQLFDLRKTLRRNLRRGNDILELSYRRKKRKPIKLIVLCDVSKSMDLYSRFFLQFLYGFHHVFKHIETYVFSTQLYRITPQLQQQEFTTVLSELKDAVPGWSGGTRIGACLESFWEKYGQRQINSRTVVIVLSDGWDTGDIDLLAQYMNEIQRKAGGVMWLNPLAGNPAFKAEVKGMKTALPYTDVFAPVHNVESLKELLPMVRALV